MKRKFVSLFLSLTMVSCVALTGCGSKTENKNDTLTKTEEESSGGSDTVDTVKLNVNENGLSKTIENGAILHCWCWSFNTIKENLPEIAAAGFSSIQTSPISQCLVGENGGMEIYGAGKWYYHYQPTDYVVGNYQLGTEDEFISMCEEAHKYGINVIVDTVINHCTSEYKSISENLTEIEGGGFHPQDGNWSETDRFEETQYALSGLWDINSQNKNVQNYILEFLKRCVADGADGFRYDAAKLIELPDDISVNQDYPEFSSDFWPTILNNGSTFQYGEDLQEGGNIKYSAEIKTGYDDSLSSRLAAYQKYMNTTNSMYGFRIRDAITSGNLNANFVTDNLLPEGASASKVVTWVESHDNFCNDASYSEMDEQDVIMAWAIIASRKEGTPLFFDRPMGSTAENPWGENVLGVAGSNMFKDAQVTAVNFFRNEVGDADEFVSNPTGKDTLVMIERGKFGAVIVNVADEDVVLDNAPVQSMADGTYTDSVFGTVFTVKDGKISGTVKAKSVSVPYNRVSENLDFSGAVESSKSNGYFLTEELELTLTSRGCSEAYYQIDDGEKIAYSNKDMIKLGKDNSFGDSIALTLYGKDKDGKEVTKQYTYSKEEYKADTVVYFDIKYMGEDWNPDRVCVYIYNDSANITNAGWPGIEMEEVGDGVYKYVLPYSLESSNANVIFNNGSGGNGNQYPTTAGLVLKPGEKKILNAAGEFVEY